MMRKTPYTENKSISLQRGQAALVIVLISVVVLTIGLSVLARVTTDVRLAASAVESAAALAAAEAGLERALLSGSGGTWQEPPTPPNIASAVYTLESIPDPMTELSYERGPVSPGSTTTIWLVNDHNDPLGSVQYNGDVTIEWEPAGVPLVFAVYYEEAGDVKVDRIVPGGMSTTLRSSDAPYLDQWLFIRVRPLDAILNRLTIGGYNSTFPSQGSRVISIGRTKSGVTRRVEALQKHPELPALFDFVMMSGTDLEKL